MFYCLNDKKHKVDQNMSQMSVFRNQIAYINAERK